MSKWRYGLQFLVKRPIVVLSILAVMVLINILVITAGRGLITSYEGRAQFANLQQKGIYTLNPDPSTDMSAINDDPLVVDEVVNELIAKKDFAMSVGMELPRGTKKLPGGTRVQYVNEGYLDLVPLDLVSGTDAYYTDKFAPGSEIPVIVGYGLESSFPFGTTWEVVDPATGKKVAYKVTGILKKDYSVSNLYSLDSKIYHNHSVVVPVTDDFLSVASTDFKVNALFETILLGETSDSAQEFARFVTKRTNMKMNVLTQQENVQDFYEHLWSALRAISGIVFICLLLLVPIVLWMSSQFVKLTIKAITINLLVGMSYRQLDRLILSGFMVISVVSVIFTALYLIVGRMGNRTDPSSDLYTYGIFGLLPMDWIALLVATGFNLLVSIALCSLVSFRVRRVPISIGVLS